MAQGVTAAVQTGERQIEVRSLPRPEGLGDDEALLSVEGNGNLLTVDTCGFNTNFDSKIGVYTGFCGGLSCVSSDASDPCNSNAALTAFCTVAGQTYYILVSGDPNELLRLTGHNLENDAATANAPLSQLNGKVGAGRR